MDNSRKVQIKVFRFNAETDYLPYYKTYEMEVEKDDLVLDLLRIELSGSMMAHSHIAVHAVTVSVGLVQSS